MAAEGWLRLWLTGVAVLDRALRPTVRLWDRAAKRGTGREKSGSKCDKARAAGFSKPGLKQRATTTETAHYCHAAGSALVLATITDSEAAAITAPGRARPRHLLLAAGPSGQQVPAARPPARPPAEQTDLASSH